MNEFYNSLQQILSFALVGALWGCTNPFLKRATSDVPQVKHDNQIYQFLLQLYTTLTNWKFIIPFGLNQSGSIVFVNLLGHSELSMAVPLCNALTFVFTAITSYFLGEKSKKPYLTYSGMILVLLGVSICFLSKSTNN